MNKTQQRISIRVQNLNEVVQKLKLDRPAVQVLEQYLKAAATTVMGEAKRRAPVDVGTLRASINTRIETQGSTVTAGIGSNVKYAPYMEYGTGMVHDHPSWPREEHVVGPGRLAAWAQRKGRGGGDFNEYAVAQGIRKRGGLMPKRYLRGALEAYQDTIRRNIADIGKRIRDKAGL